MEYGEGSLENMAMNDGFWRGKRVLITGHTGFKGSWLSLWLQSLDARLVGYSLPPPTVPSLFKAAGVFHEMISTEGDIRNFEQLKNVFAVHRPEIVIHLAAQSLVRRSYLSPMETYQTNVMGTVHLFEAIRQMGGVKVILNVTSDKCYKNRESIWGYREEDPIEGYDPYSNSKGCAELVTSAYRNSFFNPSEFGKQGVSLASARAGNVIGGGDWAEDRLIPDILTALMEKRPVVIRYPQAIRPWQHVLEPLSGYLLLIQKLWEDGSKYSEAWNFGPSDHRAMPVSWIVERLIQKWGSDAGWRVNDQNQPHEASYLKLDCSKAKARLGWLPRTDLETALDWTIDWYKRYHLGEDMRKVTLAQIGMFESMRMP